MIEDLKKTHLLEKSKIYILVSSITPKFCISYARFHCACGRHLLPELTLYSSPGKVDISVDRWSQ